MRHKEVSRCWYPDPPIEFLEIGNNIMVRVLDGEPAYQMSSGEMVTL